MATATIFRAPHARLVIRRGRQHPTQRRCSRCRTDLKRVAPYRVVRRGRIVWTTDPACSAACAHELIRLDVTVGRGSTNDEAAMIRERRRADAIHRHRRHRHEA